jgi:hypothetical protein
MLDPDEERVLIYYTRSEALTVLALASDDKRQAEEAWRKQAAHWTLPSGGHDHPGIWAPTAAWDDEDQALSRFIQKHWSWAEVVRDLEAALSGGAQLIGVWRPRYAIDSATIAESAENYRRYINENTETD